MNEIFSGATGTQFANINLKNGTFAYVGIGCSCDKTSNIA